jgi:hypothetical protein
VLRSVSHLLDRGLLEVEEKIATETGYRKPDFARLNPRVPGEYAWMGDAKLGAIKLDDQMRGLIDEASRTTWKTLLLFVPDESNRIPDAVMDEAAQKGARVIQVTVPWLPDWTPRLHGTTQPKGDAAKKEK